MAEVLVNVRKVGQRQESVSRRDYSIKISRELGSKRPDQHSGCANFFHQSGVTALQIGNLVFKKFGAELRIVCEIKSCSCFIPLGYLSLESIKPLNQRKCLRGRLQLRHGYLPSKRVDTCVGLSRITVWLHKPESQGYETHSFAKINQFNREVLHFSRSDCVVLPLPAINWENHSPVGDKSCSPTASPSKNSSCNGPRLPLWNALISQPPALAKCVEHTHSPIPLLTGRDSAMGSHVLGGCSWLISSERTCAETLTTRLV